MHGYAFVAAAKVALLALVTAVGTVLIRRKRSVRLAAVVMAVGMLIGLTGGISNSFAIGALPLVRGNSRLKHLFCLATIK